jgi:hypothetical protein
VLGFSSHWPYKDMANIQEFLGSLHWASASSGEQSSSAGNDVRMFAWDAGRVRSRSDGNRAESECNNVCRLGLDVPCQALVLRH